MLDDIKLERAVATYHSAGFAPSEIDKKLNLEEGTAHDVMVAMWLRDKNARTRNA